MASPSGTTSTFVPQSLAGMQVDVTARLGAVAPATPTGIRALDRMLLGGLRRGMLVSVTGAPGAGKTAFALLVAYMAARTRVAVLFASVGLDPTEVMARLAARTLYRQAPQEAVAYGRIWSGQAWQEETTRRSVGAAVETVVAKVGTHLHLQALDPYASTGELGERTAYLWSRHERVLLVVDGIEALRATAGGDPHRALTANSGFQSRISQVCYELEQLASRGCVVLSTAELTSESLVAPAATVGCRLVPVDVGEEGPSELGPQPVVLCVYKNRLGPTGEITLRFLHGVCVFEQ